MAEDTRTAAKKVRASIPGGVSASQLMDEIEVMAAIRPLRAVPEYLLFVTTLLLNEA